MKENNFVETERNCCSSCKGQYWNISVIEQDATRWVHASWGAVEVEGEKISTVTGNKEN